MKVIVVGGGKVGTRIASLLLGSGHWVRLIEERRENISRLQSELSPETVIQGNGTDPNVLEAAGIRQADVLAAVTGADEVNLVATSLARFEFNVPRIIGRVNNPKNDWMFTPEMGVDVALNQSELMARMVTEEMSLGDMMTLLMFRKGLFSLVEEKVHPTSAAAGKTIRELALPDQCVLVAIMRKGELILPRGDTVLQSADEVLALARRSQVPALAAMLARQG